MLSQKRFILYEVKWTWMTGHINPHGFQSPFCNCICYVFPWIKIFWTWTWTWKKKKNKIKNEKLFILVINLVEKIGRTVKQSSDLKTSSIPLQCLEAQLSSLSLVAVLLVLFVCHVHSGSHQYSWFSRISSTVANQYRKSTSLLKRSVSITSIP